MATYYVKADELGFVSQLPALEPAEGLTAVEVPMTSIDYFLRYYTKYALNGTTLTAPGNLPDLNIDYLREIVDQQGKQIDQQTKNIESLQTENKSLKSANELTQHGLMEAVDYLSSQLATASGTTDAGSTTASSAAPASSTASES